VSVKRVQRGVSRLVAVGSLVLAACTSTVRPPVTSSSPFVSRSPTEPSAAAFKWPRQARVVAMVHAPKPPADDVRLYKPILLAAYRKACSNVVNVESAFRDFRPRSQLILIRCGDTPIRAVRLVFTGVVVPNLRPVLQQPGVEEPQSVLAMLGLRWHITLRSVPGRRPGSLVTQKPSPGLVVPFGTVVHAIVARRWGETVAS
jgi:hypothetical protein